MTEKLFMMFTVCAEILIRLFMMFTVCAEILTVCAEILM